MSVSVEYTAVPEQPLSPRSQRRGVAKTLEFDAPVRGGRTTAGRRSASITVLHPVADPRTDTTADVDVEDAATGLRPILDDEQTASSGAVATEQITAASERSARVAALLKKMVECSDDSERKRLQSAVVVEHLSVAKSIASRYRGRGVERGDLEQLAYLGLVKAASRWLPGLSDDFLQFAVPTISGEIKRYFRDHSWLVRPPRRIQELRASIALAERDFQDSGELHPTDELVGRRLDVREVDIREARAAAGLCRPPSLDADSGAGLFIAQQYSGPDRTGEVDDRMSLDVILRTLSPRERTVVGMRFTDGLSQAKIGELIGVSQMQVSRILRDVVGKLRERWQL
ncbi:RNA polymerase sigma-B factor [Nakamurella sp. UYEF19]|uniref:sigma-70 family RNA polymerase sigma factor n=1 Tax=Nakamurella sp. UYEF19 TaxID=1756392 RepID=UPI00339B1993